MSRKGFTLVEMLVSVALVVIMMGMFAVVFQLAAGSIGTQRGIAENDQRARSVVTLIRSDLASRSSILVRPFTANETAPNPGDADYDDRRFDQRSGYFYISENDPLDDTDDVLQFTVKLPGTSDDLYFGKSTSLYTLSSTGTGFNNSNEPDRDDLNLSPDNTSDSTAAEVSLFMRGGRLYRRILLLRDPLTNGESPPNDLQPNDNGNSYFDPNNDGTDPLPNAYTGNFWNDFDFSAHFGTSGYVDFHSVDDLSNVNSLLFPMANPKYRFGHNQLDGLPREYIGNYDVDNSAETGDGNDAFIGRFTHEETSFDHFQFPQSQTQVIPAGATPVLINNGNPMEQQDASSTRRLNLVNAIATDTTGFTSVSSPGIAFTGARRAEDLLLPNVHAFDIKVWDAALLKFVNIGHAEGSGDFQLSSRTNTDYGPNGPSGNRVFDTWRHDVDIDDGGSGDGTNDAPPFTLSAPLRAIRITIRYLDVSSSQLRNVTIDYPLAP